MVSKRDSSRNKLLDWIQDANLYLDALSDWDKGFLESMETLYTYGDRGWDDLSDKQQSKCEEIRDKWEKIVG
jgi:hypothetical protein